MTPISSTAFARSGIEIPLSGMRKATDQMHSAAIRIAGGEIDAKNFVEMLGARYMFEANAKVIKVMNENLGTLLDTVA